MRVKPVSPVFETTLNRDFVRFGCSFCKSLDCAEDCDEPYPVRESDDDDRAAMDADWNYGWMVGK